MWRKGAAELGRMIERGETSSLDMTKYFIDRIERLDGKINSVVVRSFERALRKAKEADRSKERKSLIHGVPITVKECFWMKNTLSTCGIRDLPHFRDFVAPSDSPIVNVLEEEAGCIIIGKTNLPEHSADIQTYNRTWGRTNNPWNLGMTSGGSSGGSASSVCAGLSAMCVGSDIAGSIRIPTSFVGVCGHKPTNGLVSMSGCTPNYNHPRFEDNVEFQNRFDPLTPRLACAGPIARKCEDLDITLRVLSQHCSDQKLEHSSAWNFKLPEPRTKCVSELRVATWFQDEFCDVDSHVLSLLQNAASSLSDHLMMSPREISFKKSHTAFETILSAEMGQSKGLKYAKFSFAQNRRNVLRNLWIRYFRDNAVDVIMLPICPTIAFPHDTNTPIQDRKLNVNGTDMDYWSGSTKWAGLASLAGLPATSIPIGKVNGLPVGIQIVSSPYNDLQCIEVGKMLERIGGFGYKSPPGFEDEDE